MFGLPKAGVNKMHTKLEFVKSQENQLNKDLVTIQEAAIKLLTEENKCLKEAIQDILTTSELPQNTICSQFEGAMDRAQELI